MTDADMNSAAFRNAILSEAVLNGVDAEFGDFSSANLSGATIQATDRTPKFNDAIFNGAHLENARVRGAELSSTKWNRACLDNALVSGCDFAKAEFTEVVARKATFHHNRLHIGLPVSDGFKDVENSAFVGNSYFELSSANPMSLAREDTDGHAEIRSDFRKHCITF